ncbi:PAS domain-containing protein [soil metagenome]
MVTRIVNAVFLTPELERLIARQAEDGLYGEARPAVEAAVALLAAQQGGPERAPGLWPIGGGACGALIRDHDWSATTLGPINNWSPQLRTTVNSVVNSPVAKVLMWGRDHIMLYNDAYIAIAGLYHPLALGGTVPGIWPEIWDWNRKILEAGFRGEVLGYRDQPMMLMRSGAPEEVMFDLFYTPVHDADGQVGGVLCTVIENTERAAAQRQVTRIATELQTVTDALPVLISYIDKHHVYRFANSFYEQWFGLDRDQIIGHHVREVVGEETYEARLPLILRGLAGELIVVDATMPHRDGRPRACEVRYIPRLEPDGSIDGIHVLVFDVDERMHREEALARQVAHRERAEGQLRQLNETLEARVIAEISERRQAEASLAQSQKMETIGKLTGGVAHDFNNLLQVVSGNLQLLSKDVVGNERAERKIANAMMGVSRGAKLAAQLLAFGRRQALEPKVVNVTRFVRGMDDMLRRALGEEIEIETIVGGGLWNSFVDPAQVENAILNLAINARDAMDGQGKLTIELGNTMLDDEYARTHDEVIPGQYVMLAVTDTGSGMSSDIIDKVFEPFFSTKLEGKGSGLGLSMVYGFVKQSGGHVKIYSEVGEGTTIKLYLPRAMANEDVEVAVDDGPVTGGVETVLVVEDDEAVRATVVETLTDLGYRVLKAVDADAALTVIESGIAIDLLFTDVVMPGRLKSPELARRARERLPNLAVLFTSGYTENAIVHGGRLDAGVELLSKPYTRESLARKFRHVLANQKQRNMISTGDVPTRKTDQPIFVLLVEDDALIRLNTAEMLQEQGLTVIEAASAEDALAALSTMRIDALVTDVNLPGLSGPELAVRARAVAPMIGVVFATGDNAVSGAVAGAVVLTKPYGDDALGAAVKAATGFGSTVASQASVKPDTVSVQGASSTSG